MKTYIFYNKNKNRQANFYIKRKLQPTIINNSNNKNKKRQVNFYIKRKLQRSITESENQSDFSTMASLKVCLAHEPQRQRPNNKPV